MNIGIIGLGLIGGSLAIDFKALGHYLIGVSRQQTTCEQAIHLRIVDEASTNLAILSAAEVVFLCTPLGAMATTVNNLLPYLRPTTVLTDVGSVKTPIVEVIAPLWPNFIGGHPMAGTAESGLQAARKQLFVDKPYVLTPTLTTPTTATHTVEKLVRQLNAQLYHCQPEAHDCAVAWISHLPVMVSASLIAACTREENLSILKLAQGLASSGFRDTSRVGGGNPELGVLMAQYNRTALLKTLQLYRNQLNELTQLIEQENWPALETLLATTQHLRGEFMIAEQDP